jgi:uncharacterized protein (DUF2141 family)
MKNVIIVIATVIYFGFNSNAAAANISVEVKNIASSQGDIYAQLCDKSNFLKKCIYNIIAKAKEGEIVVEFKNIPTGIFAVSIFHDENGNKNFDVDAIGIPTEGFGVSRDARGFRGPPKFEDAAFEVKPGNGKISITLSY